MLRISLLLGEPHNATIRMTIYPAMLLRTRGESWWEVLAYGDPPRDTTDSMGLWNSGILGVGAGIGRLSLATLLLSAGYAVTPPQGKAIYVYRAYIYG